MTGMDHSHLPIAVPEGAPAPLLSLSLHKDAMSGFNLEVRSEHFVFVPPPAEAMDMQALMAASMDPGSGFVEGHAHLYVNGEKIQRLYGPYAHLPSELFREGINQITVSINNHGHMYWTVDDRQVLATVFVNPSNVPAIVYRFESFPLTPKENSSPANLFSKK